MNLALSKTTIQTEGRSWPCMNYALRGSCWKHNKSIVPTVSQILTKIKTFPQSKSDMYKLWCLCSDLCGMQSQYVGQTVNEAPRNVHRTKQLQQWFLTGRGASINFQGRASPCAPYNMESLVSIFTNEYVSFYSLSQGAL